MRPQHATYCSGGARRLRERRTKEREKRTGRGRGQKKRTLARGRGEGPAPRDSGGRSQLRPLNLTIHARTRGRHRSHAFSCGHLPPARRNSRSTYLALLIRGHPINQCSPAEPRSSRQYCLPADESRGAAASPASEKFVSPRRRRPLPSLTASIDT